MSSWIEKTADEQAGGVIAVSEAMIANTQAAYTGVERERIHVVKNGIDPDEFTPDPATDVVDSLGIDRDHPVVVFVGRITLQKGQVHLWRAASAPHPANQLVLLPGSPPPPVRPVDLCVFTAVIDESV